MIRTLDRVEARIKQETERQEEVAARAVLFASAVDRLQASGLREMLAKEGRLSPIAFTTLPIEFRLIAARLVPGILPISGTRLGALESQRAAILEQLEKK